MSTAQDIWETYRDEIAQKSVLVYRKRGPMPFYDGADLKVRALYEGSIVDSPALSKAIDGDSR